MSQYTTDEVLDMMREWYEKHKAAPNFDELQPFKGFDRLLGADLNEIDLSRDTIQARAAQSEGVSPWSSAFTLGVELAGAVLSQDANGERMCLVHAKLQGANLSEAKLERAWLEGAQLQEAELSNADLQGAELYQASLQGAHLRGAKLQKAYLYRAVRLKEAYLEDVDWSEGFILGEEIAGLFQHAGSVYRSLKQYYSGTGQYEQSGEFHEREMVMRRKELWQGGSEAKYWSLVLLGFQLSAGYGERPLRVLGWAIGAWLAFALAYYLAQGTADGSGYSPGHLREALYYSSIAFVSWTPPGGAFSLPNWARGIGLFEALLAYFLLALFLVTFVRKMARS